MRRCSEVNLSVFVIRETLGLEHCGIYWYPTLSQAQNDGHLIAMDAHSVVIVSEVDTEKEINFPVDVLVTQRGILSGITSAEIYLEGETHTARKNNMQLSRSEIERLRVATKVITDCRSSSYYDQLEQTGRDDWDYHRAQVAKDFSFLGERNQEMDAMIYRERTREGI